MCGIVGFVTNNKTFDEHTIHRMTDSIIHRGPDAEGVFFDGNCGIGHRRLSILDLTSSANQPMISSCGRYAIVYNGEVYNYKELITKLQSSPNWKNKELKTKSDTEVILELFSHFEESIIHELNGMFAIAIYDKELNTLHLIRDRMGIKPLFYYQDENNFLFASEIKAILEAIPTKSKININSILNYLTLGFIPAPNTIYNNIFKALPASHMKIKGNKIEKATYWSITKNLDKPKANNYLDSKNTLNELISDSVKLQLNSDVSNGIFLSSGIDSSLIASKAVKLSSEKIKTFTLGFIEQHDDESKYAREIANHLETDHHEIIITEKYAIDCLTDALNLYEEPNSDAAIIPTYLLSKFAKKDISVALSGEGADELFLGYGRFKWAQRLDSKSARFIGNTASYIFSNLSSKYKRVGKLLETGKSRNLVHHIFSQESYIFNEKELLSLVKPEILKTTYNFNTYELPDFENPFTVSPDIFENKNIHLIDRQYIFDQMYYLPDNLLAKIDRATMKFSLEARVPFLDNRIIEFAQNLDNNLKISNGSSKFLLKKILFDDLPSKLFERPKKGFSIPLKKWLKTDMRYLIEEYLNEKTITETSIFNYNTVKKLIKDFLNGQDYLVIRIWAIIVLQHWLTHNKYNYTE